MAQHDYVAANGSGAVVRGDFNDALLAVATMNSGASAPSITYAYMVYVNTSDGHLYQRNAANTGWIDHGTVASRFLRIEDVAAGGSAGLLRADGDGSGLSGINLVSDYPPAFITGGVLTPNASDANNDFDITACKARNDADTRNLSIAADTRQKDVIWSKAGPGGMAEDGSTGSPVTVGAGDTVHCFIIRETATGDLAFCLDTDVDGANITGGAATDGWTIEKWLGSRLVDGSSNIIPHTVKGGDGSRYRVNYDTPQGDVVNGIGTSESIHTISVPSGKVIEAVIDVKVGGGATSSVRVYDPTENNVTPSSANSQIQMAASSNNNIGRLHIFASDSGQIKSRSSDTVAASNINTAGYWEVR